MIRLLCTTAPLALLAAAPALGQDLYLGLGLGTASVRTVGIEDYNEISVLGGARFPLGERFFMGGELEFGTASGSADIDGTARLRLVGGWQTGSLTLFGSVGAVRMRGSFADFAGSNSGITWGLGIETPVQDRFRLRLEAIRDDYDTGSTDGKVTIPDLKVNTLRVMALYTF